MKQKRFKTELHEDQNNIQREQRNLQVLQKIISLASQQKLLPKFIYEFQSKTGNGNKKRFIEYQKIVKSIYGQQGKVPLKYDPQQALTYRQKLKRKIEQLQRNQLQIDYFDKVKTRDGSMVQLFKGHPIEKVSYPTKKELLIFKDFNQQKFRKSYTRIFEDKLQLQQVSLFRRQRMKTVAVIPQTPNQEQNSIIPKPKFSKFSLQEWQQRQKGLKKLKKIKLRPLTEAIQLKSMQVGMQLKKQTQKNRPHIEKTIVGKMIKDISNEALFETMTKIGSFPSSVSPALISLTKQSFAKYLKGMYDRQVRIIDFLEIKPAFNLEQYKSLCTKLKLMPVQHIVLMTFLFYDFNNDGYICDNDIRRVKNLVDTNKNHIIEEDFKILSAIRQKKQFEEKVLALKSPEKIVKQSQQTEPQQFNILELYKLPQITQTTYFNWLKKQNQKKLDKQADKNPIQENENLPEVIPQKKMSNNSANIFNPSILKFKQSILSQKKQIRQYILGIKAKKTYITFQQFRARYNSRVQNKKLSYSVSHSSRISQISKSPKQFSKQSSIQASSRYIQQKQSHLKILPILIKKEEKNSHIPNQLTRTFLWYELMDKLAGVRFQGLKYE